MFVQEIHFLKSNANGYRSSSEVPPLGPGTVSFTKYFKRLPLGKETAVRHKSKGWESFLHSCREQYTVRLQYPWIQYPRFRYLQFSYLWCQYLQLCYLSL